MTNLNKEPFFSFESYELNPEKKEARFNYRLSIKGKEYFFTEKLIFPSKLKWKNIPEDVLNSAMQSVHLALGVSYWKTYCPKNIEIKNFNLNKSQANFWNKVYTKGMGEFFYKNKIDFRSLVNFPFDHAQGKPVPPASILNTKYYIPNTRSLLLFGGGKDSYLSAELMRRAKKPFDWFFMATNNQKDLIGNFVPASALVVRRQIDPQLFELNKQHDVYPPKFSKRKLGRVYNGHVPFSTIVTFVAELSAILYGYKYIIASNDRSADYGNVKYKGVEINHQWSKSLEFERLFKNYSTKYITPKAEYFSLLRPFYEIKIVEIFSRLGKKDFSKFTSCNIGFKGSTNKVGAFWCGCCPKCAFVFALLAAFLPKKEVVGIFGRNLFADKSLLPLYRELLGICKFKPFECVGTPEEVKYALWAALAGGEYDGDAIVEMFLKETKMTKGEFNRMEKKLFSFGKHLIPEEFSKLL